MIKENRKRPGRKPIYIFTPENEKVVEGFRKSLTNCNEITARNYCNLLKIFQGELSKPMDKVTEADILDFINSYKKKVKPGTLRFMIISIRCFYKWLYAQKDRQYKKKGIYPPIVENLSAPRVDNKGHKDYPTTEELLKIIAVCDNPRDRGLIVVGYETATAGRARKELLNMKIGDVTIRNNCAYVVVRQSKTRTRTTIVKKFINEFRVWLDAHPNSDDPKAWLWPSRDRDKLSYDALSAMFKRACKRAGVKPYSLRALRHKRAKDLENVLSIREKMAYFGWNSISTAMVYGSFTSEEACERVSAKEEGREILRGEEELKKWICPACKTENSPAARFCMNCTQPMEDRTAIVGVHGSNEKIEDIVQLVLERILEDPLIKERLSQWPSTVTESVATPE